MKIKKASLLSVVIATTITTSAFAEQHAGLYIVPVDASQYIVLQAYTSVGSDLSSSAYKKCLKEKPNSHGIFFEMEDKSACDPDGLGKNAIARIGIGSSPDAAKNASAANTFTLSVNGNTNPKRITWSGVGRGNPTNVSQITSVTTNEGQSGTMKISLIK